MMVFMTVLAPRCVLRILYFALLGIQINENSIVFQVTMTDVKTLCTIKSKSCRENVHRILFISWRLHKWLISNCLTRYEYQLKIHASMYVYKRFRIIGLHANSIIYLYEISISNMNYYDILFVYIFYLSYSKYALNDYYMVGR